MMTTLIERLEAAEAGSRELDAEIAAIDEIAPHYTSRPYDLAAAMTLVPEGWRWDVSSDGEACLSKLGDGFLSGRGDFEVYSRASTPALALTAAALRAKEIEE